MFSNIDPIITNNVERMKLVDSKHDHDVNPKIDLMNGFNNNKIDSEQIKGYHFSLEKLKEDPKNENLPDIKRKEHYEDIEFINKATIGITT